MRKLLFFIFIMSFYLNVFAVPPEKRYFDGLLVESGTSTEDIMPLLEKLAKKFGKYFHRIYGQYRFGYVIVSCFSNGSIENEKDLLKISNNISNFISNYYPNSEGRVEFYPFGSDFWDYLEIRFNLGKITERKIEPSIEEMRKIISERECKPITPKKGKLVFDLKKGRMNGKEIGKLKWKEVLNIIGKKAEGGSRWSFPYYSKGLSFGINTKDGYCYQVSIFLKDMRLENSFGGYSNYKAFKGDILQLTGNETIQMVKGEFGEPDEESFSSFENSPYITYNTSYGKLTFWFGKDGKVDEIDMWFFSEEK